MIEAFAMAVDGAPVYYRVLGAKNPKLTIVLTDGIGCDGYVWKYLERELCPDYRLVHWHLPGHGRTPLWKTRKVSIPDLADHLASVMDASGTETAILAGHSMGVQIALEAYRRHRKRVLGLVLMCGSYGTPLRTFRGQRFLEDILPTLSFLVRRAPAPLLGVWRNIVPTKTAFSLAKRLEINPELVRGEDFMPYLEHMAEIDPNVFLEILAHAGRHSAKELLPNIAVPTLLIAGSHDGFTPESLSRKMHEAIPGSEYVVVQGGTHTAPIERPKLVSDTVAQFVNRIAAEHSPRSVAKVSLG